MRRSLGSVLASSVILVCGVALVGQGSPLGQAGGPAGAPNLNQTAATTNQTGALSGVVLDGTTNRPISGAIVRLSGGGVARGVSVSSRVVTDSRGRFVFRPLSAATNYSLSTSKPGYTETTGDRFPGRDAFISIADGEWFSSAEIVLWRLGSISGTVLDERGEPVIGVPVRAIARIPVAGQWQLAAGPITSTDDRGAYRLSGLGAGRFVVSVPSVQGAVPALTSPETLAGATSAELPMAIRIGRATNAAGLDVGTSRLVVGNYATPPPSTDGRAQAYPPVFYPDARTVSAATAIELKNGESRQGVDFALRPVPTSRVSGKLTGAPEAKGLVVRLLPEGGEGLGIGSEVATALVADDGTFTLLSVPSGKYTLESRRTVSELTTQGGPAIMNGLPTTPGMVGSSGSGSAVSSGPDRTGLALRHTTGDDLLWGRTRVDVGTSDMTGVTLEIHKGASISGQVVVEGTTRIGTLRLTADPASGDPALAVGIPLNLAAFGAARGAAPPSDTFSIAGLKSGEYFLRTGAGQAIKSIVAAGVDYTERPFDASSGADITGVVVTLTDKWASLSGVVRDVQGAPIRQGVVVAFPTDSTLWARFGFDPPRVRSASFFGSTGFSFRMLPGGDYNLVALDLAIRDAWQEPGFLAAAAGVATRISVNWGEAKTQDLRLNRVVIR